MVMKLDLPGCDNAQFISDVVAERQGGRNKVFFNEIKAEWIQRVDEYVDCRASPMTVQKWNEIEEKKGTILNLYLSPAEGSTQGAVISELRDGHGLAVCPSCGELGRPNTLDHYLPKDGYPHLCILPANLTPMCDACQEEKGAKVGDGSATRYFIHPYFDDFVSQRVLALEIHPPFDVPTFNFGPAPGLSVVKQSLLLTHIRELDLVNRFGKFFKHEYFRLLRLVEQIRESDQDVSQALEIFRFNASLVSQNTWQHVFYSGVLDNPDLIEYLTNMTLRPRR